jgi:hypothetical protein
VSAARRRHLVGCAWFWAWAVLGGGLAFSLISFVGVLTIVPVAIVIVLMALRRAVRRSASGLLSGAGLLFLFIAWLHREGPGASCWQTATASGCTHHPDPLPWLVTGLVLLLGGVFAHSALNREQARGHR